MICKQSLLFNTRDVSWGSTCTGPGGEEVSLRSHKPEVVSSNLTRDK